MSTTRYPLYWPEGWPRTSRPRRAAFRVDKGHFARIRDRVLRNLQLIGGRQTILSTNVPLRLDGLPYAHTAEPQDSGAAVFWKDRSGEQRAIACDRWDRVVHNLRAIELSLEALRGLERWGSSEIIERAFKGFTALPATGEHDWRQVLGVNSHDGLEAAKARYRSLAARAHPDHGGSEHEMLRLNAAMAAAKRALG